jgi:hypothetical protein
MRVNLSETDKKAIISLIERGDNNGKISLKFPGVRKKQIEQIRDDINSGTPQTKAKLKRDPLQTLYKSNVLQSDDLYAAEYIRYAFQLITDGLGVRSMNLECFIDVFGKGSGESENELQVRVQDQYNDWHDACTLRRIKTGPVMHILTEPVSMRETDNHYGFRHGTSRNYLVQGLQLYVKMFKPHRGLNF